MEGDAQAQGGGASRGDLPGLAVRKGDEALRSRLNSELSRLSERGELSVILVRWIPVQIEVNPVPRP
jgi:ABC-type amino acid transport substrate-binding protein